MPLQEQNGPLFANFHAFITNRKPRQRQAAAAKSLSFKGLLLITEFWNSPSSPPAQICEQEIDSKDERVDLVAKLVIAKR
jgi:hypothetical protein